MTKNKNIFRHKSDDDKINEKKSPKDDGSFDEISEETKKELTDFIVEKKKTDVIATQSATTSETIEIITSTQKKDGSFEINEKITSSNDLITLAQTITTNDELKFFDPPEESDSDEIEDLDEKEDLDDDLDEMGHLFLQQRIQTYQFLKN
ncbi:hypothetical protein Glove_232g145 [Diversispora epigaea]|uniref:Uncharacterized protein n=1 Tax=Diversispora epigaea TaxID=1348612 RepID=A0A397IEF8_9GLOM|nr:hypothetical protein Glove_232g145 [Diversispora epigaea]